MKTRVTNVLKHAVLLDHYGDLLGAEEAMVLEDPMQLVRQRLARQLAYLYLTPVVEPLDETPVAQTAALGAEAILGALLAPSLRELMEADPAPVAVDGEQVVELRDNVQVVETHVEAPVDETAPSAPTETATDEK